MTSHAHFTLIIDKDLITLSRKLEYKLKKVDILVNSKYKMSNDKDHIISPKGICFYMKELSSEENQDKINNYVISHPEIFHPMNDLQQYAERLLRNMIEYNC